MRAWVLMLVLAGCVTPRAATEAGAPPAAGPGEPVDAGVVSPAGEGAAEAPPPSPREGRDRAAAAHVRAVLEKLPACQAGAEVGQVSFRATTCTKRACREACCNQCRWQATFETKSGPQAVEAARVEALLELPAGSLDCEVAAWTEALRGVDVSLTPPGCRVR